MPTYHTPRCYHCFLLWNYHMSFVAEFCSNWRKCQLDRPELVVYLPGSRHWCLFCLTVNKVLWRSCWFFFKFLVISINQNSVIDSKVQFLSEFVHMNQLNISVELRKILVAVFLNTDYLQNLKIGNTGIFWKEIQRI